MSVSARRAVLTLWWSEALDQMVPDERMAGSEFDNLAHALPLPIFIQAEHRFAYVNPAAVRAFGASTADQLVGTPVIERFHPDYRRQVLERIRRLNEEGLPVPNAVEHCIRLDGTIFVAEFSAEPFIHAGRPGALVFFQDVTERRRDEAALRESEARFAHIAEQCREMIWEVDPRGVYTYLSTACTAILGYHADELVAKARFYDLHPEPGREAFREQRLQLFRQKGSFEDLLTSVVAKDGRVLQVLSTGGPVLDEDGSLRGYRGSDRDVTSLIRAEAERDRLEDQLRQVQRLNAIGRVTAQVAHDFSNLLTVIHGNTERAISTLDSGHDAWTLLQPVCSASATAAELIRALLTFSRQVPSSRHLVNLCEQLKSLEPLIRHSLPARIELIVERPPDCDCWIMADTSRLQQAILNIVINARDAMEEGGTLRISVAQPGGCCTDCDAAPSLVQLTIADTGTGMSDEVMARLFEPFFTTKPRGQGTGLGLPIVHGIVTGHGGTIAVESKLGEGSTFTITLPLSSPVNPAPHSARAVLLVESDGFLRPLLVQELKAEGWQVTSLRDWAEFERLGGDADAGLDLLILDLDTPDGGSLDPQSVAPNACPGIPRLILSSDDRVEAKADRTAILHKPFRMLDLCVAADRLIGQAVRGQAT